jgi:Cdc6-like AAA superfamily ATPase
MEHYGLISSRFLKKEREVRVLRWLPPSQMPALQANHEDKVEIESSGTWILCDESFKYWKDAILPSGLWLCGEVGAGKTILTMAVIKELKRMYGRTARGVLAYYYCSGANPHQNTAKNFFKDILRQLVETGPNFEIFKEWQSQNDESSLTNIAIISLIQLFIDRTSQEACSQMAQTTIVIDAIDEMEDKDQRIDMDMMKKLLLDSKGLLKVFISSRPIHIVKERASRLGWSRIDVTKDATEGDMNHWIDHEVDNGLLEKKRVNENIRLGVKKKLKNKAHGK